MKPTLGIYIRISKDRTNQVSTEVQQNLGVELANKLGIAYKIYFEKKGTSGGKKIIDRPKLLELVNDIEDGIITHVYFYNQDRSARDEITWFTLANLMIEYKIKLYENQTKVDLGDEDTYMVEGFKAVMNASSRRKTGKKIKDSLKLLVAKGRATNPVLTYGYKKDKNKFIIIDDEEAKIVKNIFKMSLDGIGTGTIAQILNEEGIKTRYAKTAKGVLTITNKRSERITVKDKANVKWQQNTVRQIIKKLGIKDIELIKVKDIMYQL